MPLTSCLCLRRCFRFYSLLKAQEPDRISGGRFKKAGGLLIKAYPLYEIKAIAGSGFITHGTKKRALEIAK
jgi:hypothetical protein